MLETMEKSIDFVPTIRQASREMVRELGLLLGKHKELDFTYSEGHTLLEIEKHNMLTVGELSRILQLDKSTVSRIVQALLEKNLLEYSDNPPDRRQKPMQLTSFGQKRVLDIHEKSNEQVSKALTFLSTQEAEIVAQGLSLYAKALAHGRQEKEFFIRPIEKEDNAHVSSIVKRVLAEFNFSGPGTAASDPEVDIMWEVYQQPRSTYFVITQGKKVVGGAGFSPLKGADPSICELQKMYLLPETRGLGLGEKLVRKCLKKAKAKGFSQCYLETALSMEKAQKLYRRLGFQELDKPLGDTGHFKTESWYIKDL